MTTPRGPRPTRRKEIALGWYDDGVDVIYTAAGGSGAGHHRGRGRGRQVGDRRRQRPVPDRGRRRAAAAHPHLDAEAGRRRGVRDRQGRRRTATSAAAPPAFDLSVDGVGYSTSGGFVDDIVPQLEEFKAADHRRRDRGADRSRVICIGVIADRVQPATSRDRRHRGARGFGPGLSARTSHPSARVGVGRRTGGQCPRRR